MCRVVVTIANVNYLSLTPYQQFYQALKFDEVTKHAFGNFDLTKIYISPCDPLNM